MVKNVEVVGGEGQKIRIDVSIEAKTFKRQSKSNFKYFCALFTIRPRTFVQKVN